MSESDDQHGNLSDEAIERALARLRNPHPSPLNHYELEAARRIMSVVNDLEAVTDLQDMLTEWKFKKQKSEDLRRRWPVIVAIFSVIGTAATVTISLVVNFFQSGHSR